MEQLIAGYNHRLEHSLLNDSARTSTYDALATYALRTLNVTLRGVPLLLPSQGTSNVLLRWVLRFLVQIIAVEN